MDTTAIEVTEANGVTVVAVQSRELVESTVSALRPQLLHLLPSTPARWVLHLPNAEFVASVGIGLIVQVAHKLSTAGGRLAVCTSRPEVTHLFKGPPHFLGSVAVYSDLQEAIRALSPQ